MKVTCEENTGLLAGQPSSYAVSFLTAPCHSPHGGSEPRDRAGHYRRLRWRAFVVLPLQNCLNSPAYTRTAEFFGGGFRTSSGRWPPEVRRVAVCTGGHDGTVFAGCRFPNSVKLFSEQTWQTIGRNRGISARRYLTRIRWWGGHLIGRVSACLVRIRHRVEIRLALAWYQQSRRSRPMMKC